MFAGDEKTVENLLAAGADRNIKDPKVCENSQAIRSNRYNMYDVRSSLLDDFNLFFFSIFSMETHHCMKRLGVDTVVV